MQTPQTFASIGKVHKETNGINGINGKVPKVSTDISTQASQSDIIKETKHQFVNHYSADPTSATTISTQVIEKLVIFFLIIIMTYLNH